MSFPIGSPERNALVPVIAMLLQFSPQEVKAVDTALKSSAATPVLWTSNSTSTGKPVKELKSIKSTQNNNNNNNNNNKSSNNSVIDKLVFGKNNEYIDNNNNDDDNNSHDSIMNTVDEVFSQKSNNNKLTEQHYHL